MRIPFIVTLVGLFLLAACAEGTQPALPTSIPPQLATGAAQAPTVGAGAAQAAATEAARLGGTVVPAGQTAAANAQTAVAPIVAPLARGTPPVGAAVLEVKLSEFKIDMPTSAKAGIVMFKITNEGKTQHSFQIEGQGISRQLDEALNPGATNALAVELKAGAYTVFCPVDGHKDQGMKQTLTVTP